MRRLRGIPRTRTLRAEAGLLPADPGARSGDSRSVRGIAPAATCCAAAALPVPDADSCAPGCVHGCLSAAADRYTKEPDEIAMMRHVISHLRRQDWMAVFIELVVVVVGVFIGVQASNWNEQREADQRAAVFTQRLRSDLREEAWGYEYEVGYFNEVLANAKRAADALSGKTPLSDEALLVAAYRATQYRYNIRRRATYDELTSTGEIGLIRDPTLRDLAMRLYTAPMFDSIHEEGISNPYRKAFRMAVPYEVQNALESACGDRLVPTGDYKAIGHSLDHPCSPGLSPSAIAASAAILRHDPHFLEFLRLRIADIETNLGNLTVSYGGIREGLRAVAKEKP